MSSGLNTVVPRLPAFSRAEQVETRSPFPAADLPLLYHWCQPVWHKVADDMMPKDPMELTRVFLMLSREPTITTWGVFKGDELGGYVRFEPDFLRPWTGQAHAIFKQSFWGSKTTIPALARIALEIFDAGIERISMCPFADNHAMKSLIKRLGGQSEGVLRKQHIRQGEYIDVAVFGLLRGELMKACSDFLPVEVISNEVEPTTVS